jgi:4-amino-4-deoxy-L-arabinose transferase-like glycosyltransferase
MKMCPIKKIEEIDFEKLIPFFIALFVIIILSLTPPKISNDSPLYLSITLNIHKGLGPIMPDGQLFTQKPPLFLYLIAFVFKIFSPSVMSASLVPRFFGALNVILIYLLGLRLRSNRTGAFLGATLFFSSQFIMNYNAWIQYESTLLFFHILGLILLIDGFEKGSRLLLLFSALAVVCGFYIKQTTLVLIPVPIIIWLVFNEARSKIKFYNLAFFYVPFLILVIPWYFYAAKVSHGAFGDYQEY